MKSKRTLALPLLFTAAVLAAFIPGGEVSARRGPVDWVQLTPSLIRTGLNLLPRLIPEVNVRLRFAGTLPGGFPVEVDAGFSLGKRKDEIEERIKSEQNDILRQQLLVMRDQLEAQKRLNDLVAEQTRTMKQIHDVQVQLFDYQKQRDKDLMRKDVYKDIPAGKLVVVVADFSSGNPEEGREVADEIAHHLGELKKFGIDVHLLVGEIRPGVLVRNEEMARDLGRHFPPDTDYVVLWGTMSPRTAGWYRPHLTCVQKKGDEGGVSASFELDLQSKELPLPEEKAKDQRESFNRLIGVTCAAIPGCYAAHKIGRDQMPDLGKFYEFLGKDEPETVKFQNDLEPLTRWYRSTAPAHRYLHRISEIRAKQPYPPVVVNDKDDGVMVLITDESGQPKRFPSQTPGKDDLVYIDMLETTTGQYVNFLNAQGGNKEEGGVPWIKIDTGFADMEEKAAEKDGPRFVVKDGRKHFAIIHVSWFGARAYCRWAGKALPREDEWCSAAAPKKEGKYPWGAGFDNPEKLCNCAQRGNSNQPGGKFPGDRSRISCLDMAGNVAEWCENYKDENKAERVVKGGSFQDKDAAAFQIDATRGVPQTNHERWVGFRGVVRIPVDKQDR